MCQHGCGKCEPGSNGTVPFNTPKTDYFRPEVMGVEKLDIYRPAAGKRFEPDVVHGYYTTRSIRLLMQLKRPLLNKGGMN